MTGNIPNLQNHRSAREILRRLHPTHEEINAALLGKPIPPAVGTVELTQENVDQMMGDPVASRPVTAHITEIQSWLFGGAHHSLENFTFDN